MTIDKVKDILASQLNVDVSSINEDSRIVEDLGADSLDMVELLMMLEEDFSITIPDEEAMNLKTVSDIANLIDAK